MKAILLLLLLFTFDAFAYEKKAEGIDFPIGNPSKTVILISKAEYLLLHNPEPFAYKTMLYQATVICRKNNDDINNSAQFMKELGIFTAYFVCLSDNDNFDNINNSINIFTAEEFIYNIRSENYNLINKYETKARVTIKQQRLENEAKITKEHCSRLGFVDGSNDYTDCVIQLSKGTL